MHLADEGEVAGPGRAEITDWLIARIARLTGLPADQVDPHQSLTGYGLGSRDAIMITGELRDLLDRPVSPTLAYDHPTVEALARHLAGEEPADVSGVAATSPGDEPVAVIGMGCRFPGADGPDAFWRLLRDGVDAISEVPPDRWDVDRLYHSDEGTPGRMSTRWGGFLPQVDQFDAAFFGISPREAAGLDPQQRLLLEVAWEALENAGVAPGELAGTQTGVFMGISAMDYAQLRVRLPDPLSDLDGYAGTGNAHSLAANRVSYLLDLRGPSVAVDTACSSSLVALHLACQSLRAGESRLALVGGVNVILDPAVTISFSQARMMAADGRCKTFDAGADGYVRGEGAGVVVLKPLSDAVRDGDHVYGVIRGTAVNQDGRTAGVTAPNGPAQQAVIRAALSHAGLTADRLGHVEAHGTGTSLGDPIEVGALASVLGRPAPGEQACWVSSVKTNIGHLEAAAGIAGLIKVLLSLTHETIPRHLHLRRLNPHIMLDGTRLAVPVEAQPWPRAAAARVAGVSSFGFGGTNAHVIVEEAPVRQPRSGGGPSGGARLLILSARSEASLRLLADRLAGSLAERPEQDLADVCHSAAVGRARFPHRAALVAETRDEFAAGLSALAEGRTATEVRHGRTSGTRHPKTAFLFTGQGSQYARMGAELYQDEPVYRAALDRCDEIVRSCRGEGVLPLLFPEPGGRSRLDDTTHAQPALFAVEYALAQLWSSMGVEPDLLLGHSLGEYVAACVAGVFSLEDGLRLVCERGRLMGALPAEGAMAVVFGPRALAAEAIGPYPDVLSIAAVNGPANTVISGLATALDQVLERLAAQDVRTRRLNVSHAFHSPLIRPMLADFAEVAATVRYRPARIPIVSNLTGRPAREGETLGADHWVAQTGSTVEFARGVQALAEQGCEIFVESGPRPTLISLARSCLDLDGAVWLASLREGEDGRRCLLDSAAQLFVKGVDVRPAVPGGRKVPLPGTPFQRSRHWLRQGDPGQASDERPDSTRPDRSPLGPPEDAATPRGRRLLGGRVRSALAMRQWESHLSLPELPFLADHRFAGSAVLPATGYVSMALDAAREAFGGDDNVLTDLTIRQTLFVPEDGSPRVAQLVLFPDTAGTAEFQILSQRPETDTEWTLHAGGRLRRRLPQDGRSRHTGCAAPEELRADCGEELSEDRFYDRLGRSGLGYGPTFRTVRQVWRSPGRAVGRVETPPADEPGPGLDPVLLDGCLQVLAAALPDDGSAADTYLPSMVEQVRSYGRLPDRVWSHATTRPGTADDGALVGDVRVLDDSGQVLAEVLGLRLTGMSPASADRGTARAPVVYQPVWVQAPPPPAAPASAPGSWLVFADSGGVGAELAARLGAATCVIVTPGDAYQETEGRVQVDPADPEHLARLLATVTAEGRPPLRGVVHLWSLEAAMPLERTDLATVADAQRLGVHHLVLLVQALSAVSPVRLWLVTRGVHHVVEADTAVSVSQAPVWGLGRTLRWEHPELDCRMIDLDLAPALGVVSALLAELRADPAGEGGEEIALRGDVRYAPRLRPVRRPGEEDRLAEADGPGPDGVERLAVPVGTPYRLEVTRPGRLDNVRLRPTARREPDPGQVEIEVRAAGVNFRDVMSVLGIYPGPPIPLGAECAGRVVATGTGVSHLAVGDEVVAVAGASMGSHVTTAAELVARKPASIDFEEAATVPIAFLTAHYALDRLARLRPGERVLIHSAAGGVGLAAVQLARLADAVVFATAGSPEKRAYLRDLGVTQVMDSRTLEFGEEITRHTDGQGVDVVLNALPGEYATRSLALLAPYGRFVEIGRTDIYLNRPLPLHPFRANLAYTAVDLERVCRERPGLVRTLLEEVLARFADGTLRPLPRHVVPVREAVAGFRHLAQRRNIGKVVLRLEERAAPNEERQAGHRAGQLSGPELAFASSAPSGPADALGADGTYLVTGGLGGLGLAVADWLVERGARRLVLLGRGAPTSPAAEQVDKLRRAGADVRIVRADVAREDDVRRVVGGIPALRGIVHAAGVIDDSTLRTLEQSSLAAVLAPKVLGAWHLHAACRDAPLDFFVLFSSLASVLGSPGQAGYAAANAFLDALAQARRAAGLPAVTVNWGPWAEVGMAARHEARRLHDGHGVGLIAPHSGLRVFGTLLEHPTAQAVVAAVDWSRLAAARGAGRVPSVLTEVVDRPGSDGHDSAERACPLRTRVLAAAGPDGRESVLTEYLREQIAAVLGLSADAVDPKESLNNIGLDSLMALELKERLESASGVRVPMEMLFHDPRIVDLVGVLLAGLPAPGTGEPVNHSRRRDERAGR
ncbi:SDR family NAD(P)-dependent oxidoreductase [Nonomuraea sp. NPDC049607]|uniref:SDR family NAD(P)-dependent oxidoreductase n=1 Tax=Nonomuraea sp. NPDC049607 TaxID=3154732 RepID=UPI00342BD479